MLRNVPGQPVASDFTYHWLAARAILNGESPYKTIVAGGAMGLDGGYLYPLPAALIALPFAAWLPPREAAALFVGVSTFVFAWSITGTGYARLAALGGIPFFWAASSGQFSILLTSSAMMPAFAWALTAKPNLALAILAYKPRRSSLILCFLALAASLLLRHDWPAEWLHVLSERTQSNYTAPISMTGGIVLLLAALKWRRPEARLLLVMACIPQSHVFYDQLPLILVPGNRNESMLLVITGFIGYFIATLSIPGSATPSAAAQVYGPAILISLYIPCLIMVLRRRNEGSGPSEAPVQASWRSAIVSEHGN